jgi:hypothetical protein
MQSFASELCIAFIISDEIVIVMVSQCQSFLAFFPEVAKLLPGATFLDNAATYHLYVVVVLKMHTWGATTRLAFWRSIQ